MSLLTILWLSGTAAAVTLYLRELIGSWNKPLPIPRPVALWLGVGQITILFGNLMVSFGAPDIGAEFDLPTWLVVIVNHASNFGGSAGCLVAALWVGLPRRMPMYLLAAGMTVAVSTAVGGAFVPVASISLFFFGALAAWTVLNVHVRVLASVPNDQDGKSQRAKAMGLILSPCLMVGVGLVGVPLAGSWRLGLWAVALLMVGLAATYPMVKRVPGFPAAGPLEWHGFGSMVAVARKSQHLIAGVCANFSGWVALYTIPSLAGASSDGIGLMAVAGQLLAVGLATLVGSLGDRFPRRVASVAAYGLALALVGTAVSPTLSLSFLAVPVLGLKLGWWLCTLFFAIGEACGNFNQILLEAAVSLVGDAAISVRVQLIALAARFAVVGVLNVTLTVVSAIFVGPVVGVIIGAVCTVVVQGGLMPALRRMPVEATG